MESGRLTGIAKKDDGKSDVPAISVIIPVYNARQYLDGCVVSVLGQTFANFELLLIDDGSTDGSGQLCDNYAGQDARVRVFHKKNAGVSSSRNLGLSMAKGEWISFVDADDKLADNFYESLYATAQKSEADVVLCDFFLDYGGNTIKYTAAPSVADGKIEYVRAYMTKAWTVIWNMIAKKELYHANGLNFPENISFAEDYMVAVKLFLYATGIQKVDEALYYYNRANSSSALRNMSKSSYKDLLTADLAVIEFLSDNDIMDLYEKEMCWRILRDKHDLVFTSETYDEFLSVYPKSHKFIMSCPLVNFRTRIMMWMLSHGFRYGVSAVNTLRRLKGFCFGC